MTLPPDTLPPPDGFTFGDDRAPDVRAFRGDDEFADAADPGAAATGTDTDQPSLIPAPPAEPVAKPKRQAPRPSSIRPKNASSPLPDPAALRDHGPARVLAVCNQKGGVGKTTTTINLGAALAEFGRRVLLVDFDPQGALSVGLGVAPHDLDLTVYNLLIGSGVTPEEVVMRTNTKGLDLLPSTSTCRPAEIQLVNEVAREQTLARVLRPLLPQYDYILIDCQPSLGLLTVNALTAANGVLMPLECEYFSLRGVALLIDTIEKVSDRLNPALELDGILATMYDARTIHAREVFSPDRRGIWRQRVHHRHQPHGPLPGDHGGRRADHLLGVGRHRPPRRIATWRGKSSPGTARLVPA